MLKIAESEFWFLLPIETFYPCCTWTCVPMFGQKNHVWSMKWLTGQLRRQFLSPITQKSQTVSADKALELHSIFFSNFGSFFLSKVHRSCQSGLVIKLIFAVIWDKPINCNLIKVVSKFEVRTFIFSRQIHWRANIKVFKIQFGKSVLTFEKSKSHGNFNLFSNLEGGFSVETPKSSGPKSSFLATPHHSSFEGRVLRLRQNTY